MNPSQFYDLAQLEGLVVPVTPAAPKAKSNGNGTHAEPSNGNYKLAMDFIRGLPEAISGAHGSDPTLRAACECVRFGLNDDEIRQAMAWYNLNKCRPPWSEKELEHKIESAKAKAVPGGGLQLAHYALTDTGNGERFAAQHSGRIKHVPALGWMAFTGKRWEQNATGEAVRASRETTRSIHAEASRIEDDAARRAVGSWAKQSESRTRKEAMLWEAKTMADIEARPDDFDVDPFLLNVQNCVLDLRTSEPRPHDPAYHLTKMAGTLYDPAAKCPLWESVLGRIFDGNTDLINFLQRAFGYSLTGDTTEQKLFIPYGTGANGKTTILETARAMLGEYAQQAEFSAFLARKTDAVRNDLAEMAGARFICASESGQGRSLDEALVKHLTGGEAVKARYLYKELFEYHPSFKLWLGTNHKPKISGVDLAIWRRIRLVPFTITIPEGERDPKLPAKLREELPGILAWSVRGCLAWQREGLGEPAEVRQATDTYQREQDTLSGFLGECCNQAGKVKASELIEAYKKYAQDYQITVTEFKARLVELGYTQKREERGMFWNGISLMTALPAPG